MTDAYKIALNEFKEASAAVRHAFAVQMEARAAQIIANREYTAATDAYTAATDRLAKADDAMVMVKEQPEPASIDLTQLPQFAGNPWAQTVNAAVMNGRADSEIGE